MPSSPVGAHTVGTAYACLKKAAAIGMRLFCVFLVGVLKTKELHCYPHFLPSASKPAAARSCEFITGWTSTSALKVRNHGSAKDGIFEASGRSMIRTAQRRPL